MRELCALTLCVGSFNAAASICIPRPPCQPPSTTPSGRRPNVTVEPCTSCSATRYIVTNQPWSRQTWTRAPSRSATFASHGASVAL